MSVGPFHPARRRGTGKRAAQLVDQCRSTVDRGRGAEHVEIRPLQHDRNPGVREPPRVRAVEVADAPRLADVRANAAERGEERRRLR
jgi:hypothetical protein